MTTNINRRRQVPLSVVRVAAQESGLEALIRANTRGLTDAEVRELAAAMADRHAGFRG